MIGRILRVGGSLLGGLALLAWAPVGFRHLEAFHVTRVEVVGTRWLKPHDALTTSHIADTSSVFDDTRPWRDSLLTNPLVADARIARRPPGTIRIEIRETEPVALVRTPTLRAVDSEGRLLPMDPASGDLDLPVFDGRPKIESTRVAEPRVVRALEGLGAVRALQPSLWPWISEVRAGRDDVRLVLRWPASAEVLLRLPVDSARLEDVRLVLADLAAGDGSLAGAEAGDSDLAHLLRLDARFDEQVVVSLDSRKRKTTQEGS